MRGTSRSKRHRNGQFQVLGIEVPAAGGVVPGRGNVTSGRLAVASGRPEQVVDDRAELAGDHRVEGSSQGQLLELRRHMHRPGLWPVLVHPARVGLVVATGAGTWPYLGWRNHRGKAQDAKRRSNSSRLADDSMLLPASHAAAMGRWRGDVGRYRPCHRGASRFPVCEGGRRANRRSSSTPQAAGCRADSRGPRGALYRSKQEPPQGVTSPGPVTPMLCPAASGQAARQHNTPWFPRPDSVPLGAAHVQFLPPDRGASC